MYRHSNSVEFTTVAVRVIMFPIVEVKLRAMQSQLWHHIISYSFEHKSPFISPHPLRIPYPKRCE